MRDKTACAMGWGGQVTKMGAAQRASRSGLGLKDARRAAGATPGS